VGQGEHLRVGVRGDAGPLEGRRDGLLGSPLERRQDAHLDGAVRVVEGVRDLGEQGLAEDLALVGPDPELRERVFGGEDGRRNRCWFASGARLCVGVCFRVSHGFDGTPGVFRVLWP